MFLLLGCFDIANAALTWPGDRELR